MNEGRKSEGGESQAPGLRAEIYEPPRLILLGTLADLTRGGTVGSPDGFGGAGDTGSLH